MLELLEMKWHSLWLFESSMVFWDKLFKNKGCAAKQDDDVIQQFNVFTMFEFTKMCFRM